MENTVCVKSSAKNPARRNRTFIGGMFQLLTTPRISEVEVDQQTSCPSYGGMDLLGCNIKTSGHKTSSQVLVLSQNPKPKQYEKC